MNDSLLPDTEHTSQCVTDCSLEIQEPSTPLPAVELASLSDTLQQAVSRAGWPGLMPVQSRSLPYLLAGHSLMIQSRTGSGKTGAFLLPMLERLDSELNECQAIVLVPTRELALQVQHEAETLFAGTSLKSVAVYGGVGYGRQRESLKQGVQLVIGTPGRMLDHLLNRNFTLSALRMLVLDEADRMLSIGFYPDMKEIQRYLPKKPIPVHFFSATFPAQVLRVAAEFMPEPELLSLSHKEVHISLMEHIYYVTKPMDKDRLLGRILEQESPSAAIIFCNTKANVHYVTAVLQGFGYNADELSADLSQSRREEVLAELRHGRLRFLVATDVAARGIDIPELSHVIMYEPPEDRESYIHRAGRTGRAGASGTVISLVDIMQKMDLQRIARNYKIELLEKEAPDEQDIAAVVGERLVTRLESALRGATGLQQERMQRFMPLAQTLAEDEETTRLLAMLLDEKYQQMLHAPVGIPPATQARSSAGGQANGKRSRPGANKKYGRRNRGRKTGTDVKSSPTDS